jgi:hypothetical protein
MKAHWIERVVKLIIYLVLFLVIAIAGFGQAVYHLWNWLMPTLFRLPAITFWQAVGLLGLSWLLFGGWRGLGGPVRGQRGKWRNRMSERWEQMTPEERERFRQGFRGHRGPVSADPQPRP